jgi:phosphoglycolate phosphatase-like HAD superfamily hydrolase
MDAIFDLDGTLADLTHRLHYVKSKPKNWAAFARGIDRDGVIEPIAMLARLWTMGNRVIICSGRSDDMREATEAWLAKMWGEGGKHSALYMRKAGDYRADDIIKSELLDQILADGYRPVLVVDDRLRVCNMWRARGLLLLAVNGGGDF